jgi:Mn2+/Fe2+ NRAMP family transporter
MQSPDGSLTPIVMRFSGLGSFAVASYTKTTLLVYSVTNKRCRERSFAIRKLWDVGPSAVIVACDPPHPASIAAATQLVNALQVEIERFAPLTKK